MGSKELGNSPEHSSKKAPGDISGILQEHGISPIETLEKRKPNSAGDTALKSFFSNSDISQDSPFGYFVRVRVSEKTCEDELRNYINQYTAKGEPSPSVMKNIKKRKADLDKVRELRKELGGEIFGVEEAEDYAKRVDKVLFHTFAIAKYDRETQAEKREEFIEDVKNNFPQAKE